MLDDSNNRFQPPNRIEKFFSGAADQSNREQFEDLSPGIDSYSRYFYKLTDQNLPLPEKKRCVSQLRDGLKTLDSNKKRERRDILREHLEVFTRELTKERDTDYLCELLGSLRELRGTKPADFPKELPILLSNLLVHHQHKIALSATITLAGLGFSGPSTFASLSAAELSKSPFAFSYTNNFLKQGGDRNVGLFLAQVKDLSECLTSNSSEPENLRLLELDGDNAHKLVLSFDILKRPRAYYPKLLINEPLACEAAINSIGDILRVDGSPETKQVALSLSVQLFDHSPVVPNKLREEFFTIVKGLANDRPKLAPLVLRAWEDDRANSLVVPKSSSALAFSPEQEEILSICSSLTELREEQQLALLNEILSYTERGEFSHTQGLSLARGLHKFIDTTMKRSIDYLTQLQIVIEEQTMKILESLSKKHVATAIAALADLACSSKIHEEARMSAAYRLSTLDFREQKTLSPFRTKTLGREIIEKLTQTIHQQSLPGDLKGDLLKAKNVISKNMVGS